MSKRYLNTLISESLEIEAIEAKEAGAIGYMARILTQATMPHKKVLGNEFIRSNGLFSLSIVAPSRIGLPYGTIPRLLLAWLTTESVKTKSNVVVLGHTLSGFMRELGLIPAGGRWGTITRLREQMQRLFSSAISYTYDKGAHWSIKNIQPVTQADLWWDPKIPEQASLWQSTVTLSQEFFTEITSRPIPIDFRALKTLKRSPLAIDIYCWLTYRMSYLKRNTSIPWDVLQLQFGSNYMQPEHGKRDFKRAFLRELKKVLVVYDRLNLDFDSKLLILKPSKPHISRNITTDYL